LQTDAKIVFQCGFDVVWCTQYRAPVLIGQIEDRLPAIIAEVVEEKEARLAALEVRPAYVRLSVEVSPNLGIHRLVKAIKSRSAHVLRSEFPSLRTRLPSMWTNSYLVTTVGGGAPSAMIEQFLNEQKTR
jgi:putative transposase